MDRKQIGARIKKRRKELKITQKELAHKIMKAEVTIQQYERGVRIPDLATRMLIAHALDCEYEDLFENKIHIGSGALPPDELREWFKMKGAKLPETNQSNKASTLPAVDTSGLTDHEIRELQIYRDFLIFRRGKSAESPEDKTAESSPDNNPDT